MMKRKIITLVIGVLLVMGTAVSALAADEMQPWQAADAVRDALFAAQKAVLQADNTAALAELQTAQAVAEEEFAGFSPAVQSVLEQAFARAQTAVTDQDPVGVAAARGEIMGALYWGAYESLQQAITTGDQEAAQAWLLVREFRPSTRFSRPAADATLALQQMDTLAPDAVQAQVNADLLDTYQARLVTSLNTAVDAALVPERRAEAAGLAAALWPILAPAYTEQGGQEKLVTAQLAELQTAVLTGNESQIAAAHAQLLEALSSFRAAPLSPEEQARRAGQLMRYLSLVPVEYGRGVTDGVVMQELEIQEAITFMDGAQAAFADLQPTLAEIDAAQTQAVAQSLQQAAANLQAANRQENVVPVPQMTADIQKTTESLTAIVPPEWLSQNADADFDVLASVLDQVETAVQAGDYKRAESARLEAYAIFDVGPEPRLLAFSPALVAEIDGLFWQGYEGQDGLAQVIALQEEPAVVAAARTKLDAALSQAQLTLGDAPSSPTAVATNAAIIVFREGLESVVILAALMASMVGAYKRFRKPMVLGVALSLVATAVTFWLAQVILTSLSRYGERLEAVVSLLAIAILLLITNWFFHKTYWKDWMKGFHQQKRQLLSAETGQFVGLVMLGFTSMYREGFETVLFLQALVLDAGTKVVLEGVGLGLLGVIVVGVITFRVQQRLPYKKMLVYTGVLIGIVLVTMVGKTVHVMQAVGWLGITPIKGLTFPYWAGLWFGLYATWQGLILQVSAAVFVLGSYFGAEWLQARKRQHLHSGQKKTLPA